MLAFRSLVGVTALSSAWAEECASSEEASLMQTKPQRQKSKENENDELVMSLMARATGAEGLDDLDRAVSGKDIKFMDIFDLEAMMMKKKGNCDKERAQKSRGAQKFEDAAQVSIVTGNEYQLAGEDEFLVLDKVNEVRRQGFNCTNKEKNEVHSFPGKCRNEDLIFDCQLWWAAKQHSEDMGKRNYYAHETLAPFPSGRKGEEERFNQRAAAYAWGVAAHKEVLMGASGDQDTAQVIVDSWLDSFGHCMALGTKNAEVMGVGRAPCLHDTCVHDIGVFTTGLLQQRGFLQLDSWITKLDTSCYPASRNKANR